MSRGTGITEGALNGKFSGRSRLKWNDPPLYGLSDWNVLSPMSGRIPFRVLVLDLRPL